MPKPSSRWRSHEHEGGFAVYRKEFDTVIYEKDGPIARVILNRPDKANAQNAQMVWDVDACLTDAERDYDIKVLVLKANGRGFCAGHEAMAHGDLAQSYPEFAAAAAAGHSWNGSAELFTWPVLHLWEFRKPTVSAVHGYAIGGGSYFALIPDVVIASDDAYFQMPLVQGLGFPGGETTIEPWVMMNYHRAYEYLYLAQTVDAQEAHRLGMVNRVVPRAELDDAAELTARQIAEAPLTTLMGVKALVKRAWEGMGMRTHLQQSVEVMELIGHAGDVAAWRKENAENGFGPGPRQVAASHKERAEQAFRAARDGAGAGAE